MPKRNAAVIATLAVALASAIGCATLSHWRRSMSDLALALTSLQQKYAIGEYFDLEVEITNQTSRPMILPNIKEAWAPQPVYSIRKPDGATVVYDPLSREPELRERKQLSRDHADYLGPGESMRTQFSPEHAIPMNVPGKYTVTAHFRWNGKLLSDADALTVQTREPRTMVLNDIDLESEPVTLEMVNVHLAGMVLTEFVRDPEEADTWGNEDAEAICRMTVDGGHERLAGSSVEWFGPSEHIYDNFEEWPLTFGKYSTLAGQDLPAGARLVPGYTTGDETGMTTHIRLAWTKTELWLGWAEGKKLERFPWHRIPSPRPIAKGLRLLSNDIYAVRPRGEHDAFAILDGEFAELGHTHVKTYIDNSLNTSEEHSLLLPIAQLGPDLAAVQVMLGQPEMGSPIILVAIRTIPTGSKATFMRIDSQGNITAKAERPLVGLQALGPMAMMMRVCGGMVEAAFPARNNYTKTLHVVRLASTVDLKAIEAPIVSAAIPLEGPTPSMVIDYSHFPPFFPNGVGLLLRQPGDKAFFWTEVRGLKPLPFILRDKDETLILGKRSSWYVLVNSGTRLSGITVESFFKEYRPKPAPEPSEPEAPEGE